MQRSTGPVTYTRVTARGRRLPACGSGRRLAGWEAWWPGSDQGDVPTWGWFVELGDKVPRPCAGLQHVGRRAHRMRRRRWAGGVWPWQRHQRRGVPARTTFGTFAGYGTRGDARRGEPAPRADRRRGNGVNTPARSATIAGIASTERPRGLRQEKSARSGKGSAVRGRVQPWSDRHGKADFPRLSLVTADNALHMLFRQDNIDNITRGCIAADDHEAFESARADRQVAGRAASRLPGAQRTGPGGR